MRELWAKRKKEKVLIATVFVVFLIIQFQFLHLQVSESPNLIENPGFEEYWVNSKGVMIPFDWGLTSMPYGKLSLDTIDVQSGNVSCKLEHYEPFDLTIHAPIAYQSIPRERFQLYTQYALKFWYKSTLKLFVELLFEESFGGTVVKSKTFSLPPASQWTIVTEYFVTPVISEWSGAYFGVMMFEHEVGVAYLDSFDMYEFTETPLQIAYTLIIEEAEGGITDPSSGVYTYTNGSVVPIFAVPNSGWYFVKWVLNEISYGNNPIDVVMYDNYTLTPTFSFTPPQTYTLIINQAIGGFTSPWSGEYNYTVGTIITVTAYPDSGYYFKEWNLDNLKNASNPIEITIGGNHTLAPVFLIKSREFFVSTEFLLIIVPSVIGVFLYVSYKKRKFRR